MIDRPGSLDQAIKHAMDSIGPDDAEAWFRRCGHATRTPESAWRCHKVRTALDSR